MLVLKERLSKIKVVAVLLAGLGVLNEVVRVSEVPWFAFIMAGSFGFYGLLKKKTTLGTVTGLAVENSVIFPIAAVCLGVLFVRGEGSLFHAPWQIQGLVVFVGVVILYFGAIGYAMILQIFTMMNVTVNEIVSNPIELIKMFKKNTLRYVMVIFLIMLIMMAPYLLFVFAIIPVFKASTMILVLFFVFHMVVSIVVSMIMMSFNTVVFMKLNEVNDGKCKDDLAISDV